MAVTKLSNSGIATGGVLKYDSMLAGNPAFVPTSYESIATVSVGAGGAATASFTSIPSNFTHLQIRCLFRGTAAENYLTTVIRFNGDSGSNYSSQEIYANGNSVFAGAEASATAINYGPFGPNGNTAPLRFGTGVIDILDYANTNKTKTVRSLSGMELNRSDAPVGHMMLRGGLWRSTSAITSIVLTPSNGNWAEYSHFALYGIRSAS